MTASAHVQPATIAAVYRQPNLDTETEAPAVRKERSAAEVSAAAGRMLAALARRAAAGDDDAAVELVKLAYTARELAAAGLLAAHRYGYSYGDLAAWLGVSRQAVAERVKRIAGRAGTEGG